MVLVAVLLVASEEAAVALMVNLTTARWVAAQARRVELCSTLAGYLVAGFGVRGG